MKKWILAAAVVVIGLGIAAPEVKADGSCKGPYCNSSHSGLFHKGRNLPVYQAAPWYLYWPYDGHFLTPAPMQGAFYAPPMMGNYPAQPYFPAPAYSPPYGGAPNPAPLPGGFAPVGR